MYFWQKKENMIQRIQSIYLTIAGAGALLSAFLFPMWTSQDFDYFASADTVLFSIVLAVAVISFIAVFLYKNRSLQMKFCSLNLIVTLAALAYIAFQYLNYEAGSTIGVGPFFLILPVIGSILAKRNIKKDDDLIRSVDRIR